MRWFCNASDAGNVEADIGCVLVGNADNASNAGDVKVSDVGDARDAEQASVMRIMQTLPSHESWCFEKCLFQNTSL